MTIVEERIASLKARLDLVAHLDFENPDPVDIDFYIEAKAILGIRDLSLDELAEMYKPYRDKDRARMNAFSDRLRQQRSAGPHNQLFYVENRSQARIDVIAMDVETAKEFAVRSGHVRLIENAKVFRYKDGFIANLVKRGSALGRAVREGVPGVVEKRGNNVVVGDRVFTPMTVV